MPSTHRKVTTRAVLGRTAYTPLSAAIDTEACFSLLRGRWKLLIMFHLFGGKVLRFSELQRGVTGISQKMLTQQLRQLEADGIVARTVHDGLPPSIDYRMTDWGQALCPALDSLLTWLRARHSADDARREEPA